MEKEKTSYQGQMHLLQKDMMGRYFERVTRAAEAGEGKAVYMLISGNPVELIQAFDLIPVYPEIDAYLRTFIESQRMFFVATAPLAGSGHVNVSPKGLDTFRILGPRRVA